MVARVPTRSVPWTRIRERDAVLKCVPARSGTDVRTSSSSDVPFTGFELLFLGTGAGAPSVRRNPTSVCLRLARTNWLFDCAEGSLRQLMQSGTHVSRTTKFFISHLHGDHVYGLPGMLCTLDTYNAEYRDPATKAPTARAIDLYGPLGLFSYVNAALSSSRTKLANLDVTVHEFVCPTMLDDASAYERFMWKAPPHPRLERKWVYAEAGGDRWHVVDDGHVCVQAATLTHTVTSFGYVVEEAPFPGKLHVDLVRARKLPPGPAYRRLKLGESVELPNGQLLHASEVTGPPARGRKVAILGDSADSSRMFDMAQNCDVLVHEATLGHRMVKQALTRGHSTARMAGYAAKRMNATLLALTHFSHRFPEWSRRDVNAFTTLDLAREAQASFGRRAVVPASDFLRIPIPRPLPDE